jgi:NMD protein affecting ribosome stability and mRNA decay
MKMFCPRCGKKSYGLCIDCFLEGNPIEMKDFNLSLCKCGNYFYRGHWSKNIADSVERIVRKNLKLPSEIKLKGLRVLPKFRSDRVDLGIWVSGDYAGGEFEKRFNTSMEIETKTCPDCSKLGSGYYEAIIQFRTKKPLDDLGVDPRFVSDIKRARGGFNIHVTSSGYARQLKRKFDDLGFGVKESSKLIGRKMGRDLHRITISIKEPVFGEGDFFEYKKEIFQVLRPGKINLCMDVVSKKQKTISMSKLKKSKVIARESDLKDGVVTMISPREVQVLDLEDNSTYELKNENLNLELGQDIRILRVGGGVYIL